jgi:hypothetical protein
MPSEDFIDAYARACRQFPTLTSLGTLPAAAAWTAAVEAIDPTAFDAITGTNLNVEGGSISGVLNFNQRTLIRALYARRAVLDSDFINPYTSAIPEPLAGQRCGFVVNLND